MNGEWTGGPGPYPGHLPRGSNSAGLNPADWAVQNPYPTRAHWLAYACWPIALIHGLGTGTDRRTLWLFAAAIGCAAAVAAAATWRLATAARAGTR